MSAVNNFRDTTDADILNKLRQDIESAKAGSTSQNNFTLNFISPNADTIDITDAITVNGNLQSASDTIDITDAVVQTNVNTGLFQVEDDSSYQTLWLSFDNDVVDKSGNNNSGTITGTETYVAGAISYPDGRTNKAFSFNGSSYISTGNPTNMNFSTSSTFSISNWVKSSSSGVTEALIYKWSSGGGWGLFLNSGGGFVKFFFQGSTSGVLQMGANTNIRNGIWHHIVMTYDGTNTPTGFKIYLDGVSQSLSTDSNNLIGVITNSTNVTIGASGGGASNLTGIMDDVQIWNYALSSSDITTLYNGQQIAHNGSVSPVAKVEFCDCAA